MHKGSFRISEETPQQYAEIPKQKHPAPMLQATGLFKGRIARNEMEGGYTERNVKLETDLTEPQGTLKI